MTATITSAALHIVGQCNEANKHLVQAWRAGARRAIGSVGTAATRVNGLMGERKLPLVNQEFKAGIAHAHGTMTELLVKRVERDADRIVGLLDAVAHRTTTGIEAAARAAARAESALKIKASEPLRALNLPMAQIATQIADKVAEGAKALEARIAGDTNDEAVTTVTAKPARSARKA